MVREIEQEERKITDMTAGRGRSPHQTRDYISRPSVVIKKEIPHCHGLSVWLASRGALSPAAPGRNFTCCSEVAGFGRGRSRGYYKY